MILAGKNSKIIFPYDFIKKYRFFDKLTIVVFLVCSLLIFKIFSLGSKIFSTGCGSLIFLIILIFHFLIIFNSGDASHFFSYSWSLAWCQTGNRFHVALERHTRSLFMELRGLSVSSSPALSSGSIYERLELNLNIAYAVLISSKQSLVYGRL